MSNGKTTGHTGKSAFFSSLFLRLLLRRLLFCSRPESLWHEGALTYIPVSPGGDEPASSSSLPGTLGLEGLAEARKFCLRFLEEENAQSQ